MKFCSKIKFFIGLILAFSISNDFCLYGMDQPPPPPPSKQRKRGADAPPPITKRERPRFSSRPVTPFAIEEGFNYHDVIHSMGVFLDRCHFATSSQRLIVDKINEHLRLRCSCSDDFLVCGDVIREFDSGVRLLSGVDIDTLFQSVILPLVDECVYYEGPLPPIPTFVLHSARSDSFSEVHVSSVHAPSTSLLGSPRRDGSDSVHLAAPGSPSSPGSRVGLASTLLGVHPILGSPQCSVPTARRILPVLTPNRSVVGLAEQLPNVDIMNSFICHMLYAPATCVDHDLYNFISWLFRLSPDCMHIEMTTLPAESSEKAKRSFSIFLSTLCVSLMTDMNQPLAWYAPDRTSDQLLSSVKASMRPRRYEGSEDAWLKQLIDFVGVFTQKDLALSTRRSSAGSPSLVSFSLSSSAPLFQQNCFAGLAMKILGYYCFKHVESISEELKPQFNDCRFVEMYGARDDRGAKISLLRDIKNCNLPAWLLIPFDAENATRVARRLMIRIHQYRMLLDNNVFAPQCEWCRREACSLYAQLHGYADMLIQTVITGDPARLDQALLKLHAVFDRISFFVDRLMTSPECPLLIGRAYEELMIIAKKIACILRIDISGSLLGNGVIVKDDHVRFAVNEREGAGDDGEGGHIVLDPSICGTYCGCPFRYHLHNSVNIREEAALYENKYVVSDFRPVSDDPGTGIVFGEWVICEKVPQLGSSCVWYARRALDLGIATSVSPLALMGSIAGEVLPPSPVCELLVERNRKRSTLFHGCYSDHILGYCQKLWNVAQAVEQHHVAIGMQDHEGCCLLAMQELQVHDGSLANGETLTNKMYVFQHPHAYGCSDQTCRLRASPKPMIVAMYAWERSIPVLRQPAAPESDSGVGSTTGHSMPLATPPIPSISMAKIASVYPLMYFDQTESAARLCSMTTGTSPLPNGTPPPSQPCLSPDGIILTSWTERFVLIKHGSWFEKR